MTSLQHPFCTPSYIPSIQPPYIPLTSLLHPSCTHTPHTPYRVAPRLNGDAPTSSQGTQRFGS